jgi:hypothetical protein
VIQPQKELGILERLEQRMQRMESLIETLIDLQSGPSKRNR